MGAINEYEGRRFPGALVTIETSLDAGDCAAFDTFEELVTRLQVTGHVGTTIRFGRAFTEEDLETIVGLCIV